jgi:tRNA threonylcarbamoyladenosine biosynthesis protein TsaE
MSNDVLEWQAESYSAEGTENLAEIMGKALKGGETIELISDLGGGKTTFVRGLLRGMGSKDKVASPTFTISKLYKAGSLEVHHFDFYRLAEPGIIANELAEVAGDSKAVVVIEWADIASHVLPKDRLSVTIQVTAEGSRKLLFKATDKLRYLMEAD